MSYPPVSRISYSYTGFSVGLGNGSFPGTQLDSDIALLTANQNGIAAFLETALRSDGNLNNGIVTRASLAGDVTLGVSPPSVWATMTAYAKGAMVTVSAKLYYCLVAHTSGVFATDLAAGDWQLTADYSTPAVVLPGAIGTNELADGGVTAAKLAAASVGPSALQSGAVTGALAAAGLGSVAVGTAVDFEGITPPPLWYFEYGQLASRTTFAALFAALTATFSGSTVFNSTSVTGLSVDLRGLGLVGSVIEGLGIPLGTTIAAIPSATTLTLSAVATNTGAAAALRALPHGQGDGSTTFNFPDKRGRAAAGRDDMGGTAAGRMTVATVRGTQLGNVGGSETVLISINQLPSHNHTLTDPGHGHTVSGATSGPVVVSANPIYNYSETAAGTAIHDVTTGQPSITGTAATNTTGITIASVGGGLPLGLVQPVCVTNKIIFAGA